MIHHSTMAEGYSPHGSVTTMKVGHAMPWSMSVCLFVVCCLLCLWLVWRVASGEAGKQKMGRFFCPKALTFTEESVLARFAASGLIWVALHFYYSPWYCHHNMKCMWFLLLLVYVFTCIVVSGVSFWNQRAKPKQPLHITRYYNNR